MIVMSSYVSGSFLRGTKASKTHHFCHVVVLVHGRVFEQLYTRLFFSGLLLRLSGLAQRYLLCFNLS